MKLEGKLLSLFITLATTYLVLLSCVGCGADKVATANNVVPVVDTIYIEVIKVDTIVDTHVADSIGKCLIQAQDSIKFYRDSIRYEDYINARRIEKIRYYISICEKKPTNKKFFFGWIRRTMTE